MGEEAGADAGAVVLPAMDHEARLKTGWVIRPLWLCLEMAGNHTCWTKSGCLKSTLFPCASPATSTRSPGPTPPPWQPSSVTSSVGVPRHVLVCRCAIRDKANEIGATRLSAFEVDVPTPPNVELRWAPPSRTAGVISMYLSRDQRFAVAGEFFELLPRLAVRRTRMSKAQIMGLKIRG